MSEILTLAEAERLAERVLHDIGLYVMAGEMNGNERALAIRIDHRERVASDLAGLRSCHKDLSPPSPVLSDGQLEYVATHAQRYSDGLRRTGRLYSVEVSL